MGSLNQPLTFARLDDMPEALPMIAEWDYEEWGKTPGNSIQKNLERIQAKLNNSNPPQYILVLSEGNLLGFSQLKQGGIKAYPAHTFWLGGTVVSQAFRGSGIGSALVEKVAEVAKQQGVDKLYLQTEVLDGGLYTRLGWSVLEIVKSDSLKVAVMVRRL